MCDNKDNDFGLNCFEMMNPMSKEEYYRYLSEDEPEVNQVKDEEEEE